MTADEIEAFCLAFPGTRLVAPWGADRVLEVGDEMFAVLGALGRLSFKCSAVSFAMLTERPGIAPAPCLARAHWVQLDRPGVMEDEDLLDYLRTAYGLVLQKLGEAERARIIDDGRDRGRR